VLLATLTRFGLSNHNRQRAALMPMMLGTVVRMVVMMSSTEAHRLFGSFLPQVDLYLTGYLRVKRITTEGSVVKLCCAGQKAPEPISYSHLASAR